jgi:hypothetical protein
MTLREQSPDSEALAIQVIDGRGGQMHPKITSLLTLSLLMLYIYGAPSKARNLMSYTYGQAFLMGILLLEPCISLIYA